MKDCFSLFETLKTTDLDSNSFVFYNPLEVIETKRLDSLEEIFKRIEKLSKKYYLAGYISYEAGFYFQEGLKTNFPKSFPFSLIKLGVFEEAEIFPAFGEEIQNCYKELLREKKYKIKSLNLSQNFSEYKEKIKRIKEYLREGDIYQLNYTLRYKFDFEGSAFRLYQNLKEKQKTPYTAFLKFNNEYILSISPELFFRIEEDRIICKPMKGTTKRGKISMRIK
ncbi:MAG: chorismate-binding protein [Thermodesulfobacterium sp.]|nr:chorismate-binding protein [Thermodesulfobacterium sp.]